MIISDYEKSMLKEGERIDDLQRNDLKIIQSKDKFCFGIDAVLLSDFAEVRKNEKVLDIGTGTGIIPILLTAKSNGLSFTGLEIQNESAKMAERSVAINHLEDKVSIVNGDIKDALKYFERESFNVITSNPPYMIDSAGELNEEDEITIARHEIKCTLDDVIREGSKLLKVSGRFYMVHRPFRLVEIFETFRKYNLEPKTMRMVHPFIDKEPNMVLIEAVKCGKPRLKTLKPLIVYREQGVYTDEIYDIYGMKREE